MNQSKEPIKSKEEIYKEAWAKWANETFITDPPLKKEDCDNEHSWIYGAMEDYAKQFIQSGIKGWVNIDCPLCKGTGQDTTITAFTGTCSFCKGSGIKMVKFYEDSDTPIAEGEERLLAEIERLKGLIEKAYDYGVSVSGQFYSPEIYWKGFREENQL